MEQGRGDMKTRYKDIYFKQLRLQDNWWECRTIHRDVWLGEVDTHSVWNEPTFLPDEDAEFTADCLRDIADFLEQVKRPKG